VTPQALSALLAPFGVCTELLNPDVVRPMFSDGIDAAIQYAEGLDEIGFKEKVCHQLGEGEGESEGLEVGNGLA